MPRQRRLSIIPMPASGVRPGIMLYGYHTATHLKPAPDLRPVLSLTTKVAQVRKLKPGESTSYNQTYVVRRPSRIAVLPLGYADGYSRLLSNRASVLIQGKRAPVVGRVCMDMTMVAADRYGAPGTRGGHDRQQDDQQITAATSRPARRLRMKCSADRSESNESEPSIDQAVALMTSSFSSRPRWPPA
jgi:hypothetical protein